MNRSEYRGFWSVFKFTLTQALSSTSLRVTYLLLLIAAVVSFPVMNYMNGEKDVTGYESPITKVHVINNTGLAEADFSKAVADVEGFDNTEFVVSDKDSVALSEELAKDSEEIILEAALDVDKGAYVITLTKTKNGDVSEDDLDMLGGYVRDWFDEYKIAILEAGEDTIDRLLKSVDIAVSDVKEYLNTDTVVVIDDAEYNMVYALIFISYMVIMLMAGAVASKVVEEKANRVVEYLMTTVRPMALIMGKVIAMMIVVGGEIILTLALGILSNNISARVFNTDTSALENYLSAELYKNISPFNFLLCMVCILLGMFIYALLSGCFGASVSKMEDLQQGLKVYTTIVVVAFLMSTGGLVCMRTAGVNWYVYLTMLLPFTSCMVLPGAILIGKASVLVIITALLLQAVTALLVLKFVSLIYESIIVMNGNIITLSQMMQLIRQKRDRRSA